MADMLTAARSAAFPVALTGAGISAPSGLPTFQADWKGRPIRDFLSREYFASDPYGFFELYCAMEAWGRAEPNAAHQALARLKLPVITQNIDGLHQKAGSSRVVELHGNLRNLLCPACGATMPAGPVCQALRPLYAAGDKSGVLRLLRCACGGALNVDVVLYGDAVRGLPEASSWLNRCDLLLVIGTSLQTYPAALLPDIARRNGARVLIEDRDCIGALSGL